MGHHFQPLGKEAILLPHGTTCHFIPVRHVWISASLSYQHWAITSGEPQFLWFSWYNHSVQFSSVQFSSVAQSCLTLCDPIDCSMPGFPVHHQLPELAQTHVHLVGDAIQPSHPLLAPSPHAFNLPQHQGLFQWVSSSHQVAKVLEFQLQYQCFQQIFRTDFL